MGADRAPKLILLYGDRGGKRDQEGTIYSLCTRLLGNSLVPTRSRTMSLDAFTVESRELTSQRTLGLHDSGEGHDLTGMPGRVFRGMEDEAKCG